MLDTPAFCLPGPWTKPYTSTMAAKRRKTTTVVRASTAVPTVRIQTTAAPHRRGPPRYASVKVKKGGKRRGRGGGGGLSLQMLGGTALGGAALGFIEKQWPNAPTLPIIGRAGTIALAAYYFGGKQKPGLMRDIALSGAAVAGYELGKTGKIAGEDVLGDLAPQVGGAVAAQV